MTDTVDVIRMVGPRAFGRGRDLVRASRVDSLAADSVGLGVVARVDDHDDADPYRCRVERAPAAGAFAHPVSSTCSCPLGGDCAHVAATLLALNARTVTERANAEREDLVIPAVGMSASPDDWRPRLAGLVDAPSAGAAGPATPLGLLFDVRGDTMPSDRVHGGNGPARRNGGGRQRRLGVRPVTRSTAGNWVRGQLTWASLPYSEHRLGLDHDQHRWFLRFSALQRSDQIAGLPGESDWVDLDTFSSALLWPLLQEAKRLGIAFVTPKRPDGVVVGAEARVLLDTSRVADGSLAVAARAIIDGEVVLSERVGIIGNHGIYTFGDPPESSCTLAATSAPIRDELIDLLASSDTVVLVPPDDVNEFVTDWSHRLHEQVGLVNADGTIPALEQAPPVLVLTARFESDGTRDNDRVALTWRWNSSGATLPLALHGPLPVVRALFAGPHADDVAMEFSDGPGAGVGWFADGTLDGADAAAFTAEVLPALDVSDTVRVTVVGKPHPATKLTGSPTLTITTVESKQNDWFDLGVIVTVQGRTVPLTPLLTAIGKRDRRLKLIDGSYLSLADPVFDRLKALVDEARELTEWEPDSPFQISARHVGLWSEFDQIAHESTLDARWRAVTERLLDAGPTPAVDLPSTLHTTLRPYQIRGYAWLSFLIDQGLGGVLADDMGLGKTVQMLAAILRARELHPSAPPFLVVAPTSVVGNWAAEAASFAPSLRVHTITGTAKGGAHHLGDADDRFDVIVTSYALLRLDAVAYRRAAWSGVVLDEAQFVKNPQSLAHRAAADLHTPVTIALTGTPLENTLTDIWALFRLVAPGLLSSSTRFGEEFAKPLASPDLVGDARTQLTARLRARIRPFVLRRTKAAVAADLPEKQEQLVSVTLDPAHRERYDATLNRERLKLLDLVDDLDRNRMIVFRSLTLLRMLALSPALVSENPAADSAAPSAKILLLTDELQQLAAEGRRALVFSQFTSFLGLVAAQLEARGVEYEYLDGSTRKRDAVINRFRNGDAPAFLISLKAGGFGLTLTEADTVFLLDPWWNPAVENQAIDRAHRIGQTRPVSVQRFIAAGTIEEKVLALAARKADLFRTVIDDGDLFANALTADDVRTLLS